MRYVCWNLAAALCLCISILSSGARASLTYSFEGVDITPLVKYYSTHVVVLTKSVTIYNWARHGDSSYWDKEPVQGEPSLIQMAKNETKSFWGNYGSPQGANNMYGYGLYAAVDPYITFGYGGGNGNLYGQGKAGWLLFEMQLPVGFKLIDLGYSSLLLAHTPDDVKALTNKFDCSSVDINTFFVYGGASLTDHCRRLVKEIFERDLKIDGFAYYYTSTPYKGCDNDNAQQFSKAFVLTDEEWITPKNVKFFTPLSTTETEERIRLQTLFLKARVDQNNLGSVANYTLVDYLTKNPDSVVNSSTTTCQGKTCIITVHFCDSKNNCEDVNLPALPRAGGGIITQDEASQDPLVSTLLWADLEGKPKSTDITIWLKDNKYGCSGEAPFNTKNFTAGESK